jgi:carboxypeptidase Taq
MILYEPSTISDLQRFELKQTKVTYCLHIIIRFEIEQDLIPNRIMVKDLPEIWNQKYKDYLDLDIENDSEGVMQDIHWSGGDFGYFPTYALGNIISGQLLNTMQKSVSDWKEQISTGNFQNVKKWLVENVHQQGDLYDPPALIKKITGEKMNSKPYLEYLNKKCSWVYGY